MSVCEHLWVISDIYGHQISNPKAVASRRKIQNRTTVTIKLDFHLCQPLWVSVSLLKCLCEPPRMSVIPISVSQTHDSYHMLLYCRPKDDVPHTKMQNRNLLTFTWDFNLCETLWYLYRYHSTSIHLYSRPLKILRGLLYRIPINSFTSPTNAELTCSYQAIKWPWLKYRRASSPNLQLPLKIRTAGCECNEKPKSVREGERSDSEEPMGMMITRWMPGYTTKTLPTEWSRITVAV